MANQKQFADIPLDNVIMSPDSLIRIKNESEMRMLLDSREK